MFKLDTNKYFSVYRGIVRDNNDPLQIGRIKVEILPMYKGIRKEYLPYAIPMTLLFNGAGEGYGSFAIPNIGSWVYCLFEEGNVYQPIYIGEAISGKVGIPDEAKEEYPYTKVIKTKNGIIFKVIDKENEEKIEVIHPASVRIMIDKNGINISSPSNASINIKSNGTLNIFAEKEINMTSNSPIKIQGQRVDINPI